MSAEIEFQDENLRKFLTNFDVKLKEIKNGKREYAGLMAAIVYEDINRHFENEEGSQGPWKEWSASYQAAIRGDVVFRKFGGRVVPLDPSKMENPPEPPRKPGMKLQDNAHLKKSFKPTNFRSVKDGILWFNNAKTSSGFPYAFAHDEGGSRLPKRDFMWLSDKAMEKISEQTLAFILDKGIK